MIDLLNDLADVDPWYEDFSVWRYASTAYWWQNQCAVVRVARNIEIGFCFNLDGLQIRAAWWYADAGQITLFRAAAAADGSGRALEDLVSSLAAHAAALGGQATVLTGSFSPGQLERLPARKLIGPIHFALLDCPDDVLAGRLRARVTPSFDTSTANPGNRWPRAARRCRHAG